MPNKPGQLVVLCGPSGVGKSTISRRLSETMGITYTVSATTRPKRPGDDAGKKYQFMTKEEFFRRLDKDEFLEYAEVYGEYYGTPKASVLADLARARVCFLETEVKGVCKSATITPIRSSSLSCRPMSLHSSNASRSVAATARKKSAAVFASPRAKFT